MKLFQLLESPDALKKGQKIIVTKDSPTFHDAPMGSFESRYSYSFKKGDILRIYSIGKVWALITAISEGTGIYNWKNGTKVTKFDIRSYTWRINTSKMDESWYDVMNDDDLPKDHIFTTLEEAKDWINANGGSSELKDNGDGTFNTSFVKLTMRLDTRLRVKFHKVKSFMLTRAVENYDLLPDEAEHVSIEKLPAGNVIKRYPKGMTTLALSGGSYKSVSELCGSDEVIHLDIKKTKKLTSLKGIKKKFPNLKELWIFDAENIKNGLLELAMFNSIALRNTDANKRLKLAFDIVKKHAGSRAGMIDAQGELIDNDLEDFI